MTWLRRFFRHLFRQREDESAMQEEMAYHLAMRARQVAEDVGATPEEARLAALRRFGNIAQVQEDARAERTGAGLERLGRDLAHALRALRKAPGYALTATLTLALGVGATTAVYSVVHALLLAPLPYPAADRLVEILSEHREQGASGVAPGTFGDLRDGNASFAAVVGQYYYYLNLTGVENAARVNSADVTADYFSVFNVAPLRGRIWTPAEVREAKNPVVILGHALWESAFGARESIVGQTILLDDTAYTVIGVMPSSFKDPAGVAQLWRPMRPGADDLQNRSARYWTIFGRLKPGVALEQANAELATLAAGLVAAHPRNYEGWTLRATDLRAFLIGNYRTGLLVVLGAVGCVMLITCANLTGLAIVRAFSRRRELAVRTALGASRPQLVVMLLTEGLVLAGVGGTAGVLLATWGVAAMRRALLDGWLPRADEIAVNLPVLFTCLGVTILTGLVSGIIPGFTAARVQAGEALKDSSRGSTGPAARRLRGALIVTEIALALILLAGTGLLARSFLGLLQRQAGVEAGRVLSVSISLSGRRYDSPAKSWDYYSRAESAVSALPGVEAAGFTQTSPFRWGIPVALAPAPGEGASPATDYPEAYYDSVGVDYFRAIGCPLIAGRLFAATDNPQSPPVIVLSETAARRYFGHGNPLGRHLTFGGPERFEIVGIAGDVRRDGLATDVPLQVYRPLAQRSPAFGTLMVRTSLPPDSLTRTVREALKQIDPDTPVSDVATLETMIGRTVTQPKLYLVVFGLFAAVALLLAAVGLYGLITYSVSQRTREFGIRTALGATPHAVRRLVLGEAGILVVLGVALGLIGALAAAQLLRNLVFATSLHDPAIFVVAPLTLAVVAIGACLVPARRATRVNPLVALRDE